MVLKFSREMLVKPFVCCSCVRIRITAAHVWSFSNLINNIPCSNGYTRAEKTARARRFVIDIEPLPQSRPFKLRPRVETPFISTVHACGDAPSSRHTLPADNAPPPSCTHVHGLVCSAVVAWHMRHSASAARALSSGNFSVVDRHAEWARA